MESQRCLRRLKHFAMWAPPTGWKSHAVCSALSTAAGLNHWDSLPPPPNNSHYMMMMIIMIMIIDHRVMHYRLDLHSRAREFLSAKAPCAQSLRIASISLCSNSNPTIFNSTSSNGDYFPRGKELVSGIIFQADRECQSGYIHLGFGIYRQGVQKYKRKKRG
jgi:hypothetical protein